jgi:hypothetical protein
VTTDIADNIAEAAESLQKKWIAIYIATLAVLLSICSIGADNSAKTATRANIQAADTFAFYQAKNVRQTAMQLAADQLELTLSANPSMPPEAKAAIQRKIDAYKTTVARYESEPEKGEGKKELLAKAREWQQALEGALAQDPYFDYAQAFLQIAIVLASASIIAGGSALLGLSGLLGLAGALLMLNGFTLAVQLPFIS